MPNLTLYVWDSEIRAYRRKSDDEIISESQIDDWIDETIAALALLWQRRASQYAAQEISFEELFNSTAEDINSMHLGLIALAFGGVNLTEDQDYNRLRELIDTQLAFFYSFAVQIRAEVLSDAMIAARLALYALAGYGTYQNARTVREQDAGMKIYRRRLGVADHCDDCVEYASRGWQMIGTLPRIGDSVCRSRCHCHFEFSDNLLLLGTSAPLPTLNP